MMNLKFRRQLKVEKKLLQIVAQYLISGKFKGRLLGIVSVSSVKVSGDLRFAKIFIKTLGSDQDKKKNLNEIILRTKDIQKQLNLNLKMKFSPRLQFLLDENSEKALKLERFLNQLN